MSYARNLARLSRAGVPSVNSLQDIRDLTIYDGLYPPGVIARWHTTKGDGGGGYFNIITGEVPGAFVDDDGVTVVFTAGDGSAAAVREIELGEPVFASWFGAGGSSTGDDTAATQAAIDYAHASRQSTVRLGPAHRVTNLVLKNDVVLEGIASSGDISDPFIVPDEEVYNKSVQHSTLVQIAGTTGACVSFPYQDEGDNDEVRGRAYGLRNVTLVVEDSSEVGNIGIEFMHGSHIVMNSIRVQGFEQQVILSDQFDCSIYDLRTSGGAIALQIVSDGSHNNSNNLIFFHSRLEGWSKCGLWIRSGAPTPYKNNKISFYWHKQEGTPGKNGIDTTGYAGMIIDGISRLNFFGGISTIKPGTGIVGGSSDPMADYTILDFRQGVASNWDVNFDHFGVSTNGGVDIDSLIRFSGGEGSFSLKYCNMSFNLIERGDETFANGIINVESDSIEDCSIEFEQVYLRDELTLFGGLGPGQFYGNSRITHQGFDIGSLRLQPFEQGDFCELRFDDRNWRDPTFTSADYWRLRNAADGSFQIMAGGSTMDEHTMLKLSKNTYTQFTGDGNATYVVSFEVNEGAGNVDLVKVNKSGRLEMEVPGEGVRLTSPDGLTQYKISMDDAGNLLWNGNIVSVA